MSLGDYKGKVLLIVNTATGCGFTPHYEPLEAMYKEMKEKGYDMTLAELETDIARRDKADSEREISPLVQAPDADLLDTTGMDIAAVVRAIVERCGK